MSAAVLQSPSSSSCGVVGRTPGADPPPLLVLGPAASQQPQPQPQPHRPDRQSAQSRQRQQQQERPVQQQQQARHRRRIFPFRKSSFSSSSSKSGSACRVPSSGESTATEDDGRPRDDGDDVADGSGESSMGLGGGGGGPGRGCCVQVVGPSVDLDLAACCAASSSACDGPLGMSLCSVNACVGPTVSTEEEEVLDEGAGAKAEAEAEGAVGGDKMGGRYAGEEGKEEQEEGASGYRATAAAAFAGPGEGGKDEMDEMEQQERQQQVQEEESTDEAAYACPATAQQSPSSQQQQQQRIGLQNLGNTCYLNSALQMLMSLDEFVDDVLRNAKTKCIDASDRCVPSLVDVDATCGSALTSCGTNATENIGHLGHIGSNMGSSVESLLEEVGIAKSLQSFEEEKNEEQEQKEEDDEEEEGHKMEQEEGHEMEQEGGHEIEQEAKQGQEEEEGKVARDASCSGENKVEEEKNDAEQQPQPQPPRLLHEALSLVFASLRSSTPGNTPVTTPGTATPSDGGDGDASSNGVVPAVPSSPPASGGSTAPTTAAAAAAAVAVAVDPTKLKQAVDERAPQFVGYEQQDSHEFLGTLLDLLHDEAKEEEEEEDDDDDEVGNGNNSDGDEMEIEPSTSEEMKSPSKRPRRGSTLPSLVSENEAEDEEEDNEKGEEEKEEEAVVAATTAAARSSSSSPPPPPRVKSFSQLTVAAISQLLHGGGNKKKRGKSGLSVTEDDDDAIAESTQGEGGDSGGTATTSSSSQSASNSSSNSSSEPKSPVDAHFATEIRTWLTCDSCKYARSNVEMYRYLSLDIATPEDKNGGGKKGEKKIFGNSSAASTSSTASTTLEESIRAFFASEKREVKCEKCFGETATQTSEITRLPLALLLHLKRFIVDVSPDYSSVTYRKDGRAVEFGETIPIYSSSPTSSLSSSLLSEFMASDCVVPPTVEVDGDSSIGDNVKSAHDSEDVGEEAITIACEAEAMSADGDDDDDDNNNDVDAEGEEAPPAERSYRLRGIVNHIGQSANRGHYTADAYTGPSKAGEDEGGKGDTGGKGKGDGKLTWTRFNDSFVSRISAEEAIGSAAQKTAYMILYSLR